MSYLAEELRHIVARFAPRGAPRSDGHDHDHQPNGDHGHTHEHLDNAGRYEERDLPKFEGRDWDERAFTVGIGGLVG
jgi:urease accessory protein